MAEPTAQDIRDHAAMLLELAELVESGMLTAAREPGSEFTFSITDAGRDYVEAMPHA